jgi:dienelactone hydrolase
MNILRGVHQSIVVVTVLITLVLPPAIARPIDNVRLDATPELSAVDDLVRIKVVGLKPRERVAVATEQHRFGFPLRSEAIFVANRSGSVDLSDDAPVSGDYTGVDPMGLFWSMKLAGKPNFDSRSDAELQPFDIKVTVAHAGTILAATTIHRYVVASSLVHREINRDGLVAAFFTPNDGAKHPAVIVLNGSDGGLQRDTAALLARHGFCTLAVAYFGIGSLPKYLEKVPIEVVDRALAALDSMANVDPDRVGLVGFSKGAELALVSASRLRTFKAVVAYAPSSAVFEGLGPSKNPVSSWTFRGKPLPFANGKVPSSVTRELDKASASNNPVSYQPWYLAKLRGASPQAMIPVEAIRGAVLLIAGGDDQLWPSGLMARQIEARRRVQDRAHANRLLLYTSAGHAIELPFVPTPHTIVAGQLMLGGTPAANAYADSDSWQQVLTFLRAQL